MEVQYSNKAMSKIPLIINAKLHREFRMENQKHLWKIRTYKNQQIILLFQTRNLFWIIIKVKFYNLLKTYSIIAIQHSKIGFPKFKPESSIHIYTYAILQIALLRLILIQILKRNYHSTYLYNIHHFIIFKYYNKKKYIIEYKLYKYLNK